MNEHVLKALNGIQHVDGPPGHWLDDDWTIAYVTLCVGGVRPEGERVPILCATEEMAWAGFAESLERYIAQHAKPGDILYWRMRPELWPNDGKPPYFTVGARLALASATVLA